MIQGLENANFVKYGVMHKNTYINSTKILDNTYNKLNIVNISLLKITKFLIFIYFIILCF